MKQNTLYTINRWNKGGINKVRAAKFDDGGALWDRLASNAYGANYGDAGYTVDDYMNSKNAFGISKKNNPFSKGNIKGTMGSMAGIIGSIPTGERRGMFDTLDPLHYLAGGRESKVGNVVGDAGVGIFQMGAQSGNGALMLAGGIAKGIGSLINAGWGIKENKANIAAIDANTAAARSAGAQLGNATTNEDVLAASGNMVSGLGFKASDLYKNGWFTNKGTRKGNAKINTNNSALAFQTQGLATGVDNADYYSDSNTMRNFIGAFGGPLPAVDYNFIDRYLTAKEKQNELKSKLPGLTPMSGLLAFGGDMQTNSSDFSTGATHVNAGGTHEESPYDGVQMGVDSEGIPNLVEEGEIIYNDYVYSDRIQLDDEAKEKFHFSKKKDLTYAEAAKKLEKEISERPNDPLSQAAYKAQMEDLANEQERQKQEMEADRAREAFESLSDEDKVALMQQVAQEEQMAQQQAMEEQAMAEQQMMNSQVAQEVPQEAVIPQEEAIPQEVPVEPQTMAEGGNLYLDGGILDFVKKNYKGRYANEIANVLESLLKENKVGRVQKIRKKDGEISEKVIYDNPNVLLPYLNQILNGKGNRLSPSRYRSMNVKANPIALTDRQRKHFDELVKLGLNPKIAFELSHPEIDINDYKSSNGVGVYDENGKFYYNDDAYQKAVSLRKNRYDNLVGPLTPSTKKAGTDAAPKMKPRSLADIEDSINVNIDNLIKELKKRNPNITEKGIQAVRDQLKKDIVNGEGEAPGKARNLWYYFDANPDKYMQIANDASLRQNDKAQTVPPNNTTSQPAKVNASKSSPQRVASTNKAQPTNTANVEVPQTTVSPTVSPDALTMSDAEKAHYNDIITSAVAEANGLTTPTIVGGGDTQSSYITTTGNGDNVDSAMREATGVGTNGYVTVNPVTGNVEAVTGNDNTTGKKLAPVLKAEWPRYVGLFGPAVGLGLMAAGVGKPNKKQFDAILDAYDRTGTSLADYKIIGDYLTYRPMDIWAEQNRMNANARATDRAILNNSSPVGTRMAGLLASNYNDQIGSGQLYKNALEYNDSKAAQVAGFNRGTNQYNADAYNRAALANAQMRNQSRHYRAGLAMQAAAQKADMDAGWYNSLYGNIGQLFKGVSDLGRENAERNMIARLATAGAFGNLPPENAVNAKLSEWVTAEGGKLKKSKKSKRKGLTF